MKNLLRVLFVCAMLSFFAGCNTSGMSPAPGVVSVPSGSGDEDLGDGGSGEEIAKVHNPEPATMLLWGIGLAGAAIARRKRKINP